MRVLALLVALLLAATPPAGAARFGAAFLDTGLGGRALGLGGAAAAVADGPAAVIYNPAGLASTLGRSLLASYQPLSLERRRASLAAAMNLRGGLAFGLAWLHAGVGGLQARSGSGEVAGNIDDTENAFLFALGLKPSPQLQVGLAVKVIDHRIDVPQIGESTADGRGVDLGLRWQLDERTVLALVAHNLLDKLSWTVSRPSSQTSTSREDLRGAVVAGLSRRWRDQVLVSAEVETFDGSDGRQARGHVGAEARLSPLLTVRLGVARLGDADGVGLPSFGFTLQPMRRQALQVHYAWIADDLDTGARSVLTLSSRF